ncbi:MAG TPA: efflux RND transporter periplasmic adaptor subunit [Gemmatimonadaceae bacterium]|jgi:RND family efflux transporter MFP subunit|nr:efflux RND transporter periplasmic adaptor subunit [Gemmatimonadaceae bacterium]
MIPLSELPRRITAGGCAVFFLLVGCGKGGAADAAGGGQAPKATVAATTAVASVEPFTRTIPAIGEVVARPDRFAALSAPAPTRVSRVYVAEGQRVAAGAPLVEFEQVGFNAAASGAQAALTAAQRNYERAERLSQEGIVPRRDVDQAAADLGAARAAAVTARREQQLSVLRSPVAGVVTRMSAVLGASADAGQTLVEVADPSAFDVVLSLGPGESGDVHAGARVAVSAGEKSGGESLGAGTVASVAATVDSAARSVAIRVSLKSPRRSLKLGESVYGEIAVETRPNAVVVPAEALVPEGDSYKVFVVDKSGIATSREVKIGGRTETKVEILEGLSGGETVVTQGAYGLEDSVKVVRPEPAKP